MGESSADDEKYDSRPPANVLPDQDDRQPLYWGRGHPVAVLKLPQRAHITSYSASKKIWVCDMMTGERVVEWDGGGGGEGSPSSSSPPSLLRGGTNLRNQTSPK